jgi:hypothetical protein
VCSLYRDVQYSASITNLWLPFWGVFSGKPKKKGGSPKKQKKESVEPATKQKKEIVEPATKRLVDEKLEHFRKVS